MSDENSNLKGLKVLVIDDSKTIRRTAETLLAKEGCEVFTAIDGFDALAKIADHQPDIVFVDIMMPRLDGYQTCSLIKHNKVFRDDPGDHAVLQGRTVRPCPRPDRRLGALPDQAVHQGRAAWRDRNARREVSRGPHSDRRRFPDRSACHEEGAGEERLQDRHREGRRRKACAWPGKCTRTSSSWTS